MLIFYSSLVYAIVLVQLLYDIFYALTRMTHFTYITLHYSNYIYSYIFYFFFCF